MTDFHVGFVEVTAADYFRDPCMVPSLSASIAWTLLNECPAKAWLEHPRLGGQRRPDKRHFDRGAVVHELTLKNGKGYVAIDAHDYKTQAAQAQRDLIRAAGKTPILKHELDDCAAAAKVIRRKLEERGIKFRGAKTELGAMWVETADDGTKVQCRAMFDYYKAPLVLDLKSARSVHRTACEAHASEYGYALKAAAYTSAVEKISPALVGRVDFVLAFAELESPYFVTPARLSAAARQMGLEQWRSAINAWARCTRLDAWPDYTDGEDFVTLEPTPWAVKRWLGTDTA